MILTQTIKTQVSRISEATTAVTISPMSKRLKVEDTVYFD